MISVFETRFTCLRGRMCEFRGLPARRRWRSQYRQKVVKVYKKKIKHVVGREKNKDFFYEAIKMSF